MNGNDANLNSVNGSKKRNLTIKFKCLSGHVQTCFSVKIEPGDIDETYMLEQLIDLLHESEVLLCSGDSQQWKDCCRTVYKGSKTILNEKPRILALFNGDTLPMVCFVGTGVNDSNYFGKTITFKELLRLRDKIRNEKQTTKHKICIEKPNKASGNFDAILKDSNDNKFYLKMPKNGCNSEGLPIKDSKIFDMMFYLKMLHFGETNNLAYIDSNYIGKTMKYDALLSLYNQKKRYGRDDISYSACITDVDNWNVEFYDDNYNNNGELVLKISREDFNDSGSTWQSVINALVSAGILCNTDIVHFGKTITCKGVFYLARAIIKMLVDVGILKHKTELQPNSKLYVALAYNEKTIALKEALRLYDKVISQQQVTQDQKEAKGSLQLKIWCSDKIGDGFTVEINQDDIDSKSSSQYLENIVNSVALIDSNILKSSLFQILLDTKILNSVSENITLVHNKNFVADDWNKKSLKQKFNELKCPVNIYAHGSVLSNNEYVGKKIKFNELIKLLTKYKNQNQQNEIIADESKDENGNINHNLNKVVKPNSEELKNNDANKVVDNLKETSSQTESKKNKINETILFNCRKKGAITESFSLEINCDDIDNNLLFKDFIKELVAKGVFYCSSDKVLDPCKVIYCNGVPASELTVGEVLKLPAASVQNKFIVALTRLHINGAYVNKTVNLEDIIKPCVQSESQKQLNKKSLEQPKLKSTLLKDNLDEGKKENEADKDVKDGNNLLIPFRCGSEKEQQIFNLELEDDDIKHDYQLQELVKILLEAKILTCSKKDWQFDYHISCRGYSLADKSVNEALKLLKNEMSPFRLLQTQIGSEYNNQTMKLKDVIELRDEIKNRQQISNEKQNKHKENKVNLDDVNVVICKREGGWKSANYSVHDAHEKQKSISEAFNSYITPKITLFESVFCDSSDFNKQMTFKSLIELRNNLKSEELKKQGHLSEKSAQPKIDKTKSKTLVDKNNLSNLFQHSNKFKDKDKINQQSSENSPTSSLTEKNEYQKKYLVDKDINSVLKLKSGTVPGNKNIKKGCFAMKKNSESDEGQGYVFEGGNSFYIKFDDLLAAIKKILKLEDANEVNNIDIQYGAHMCYRLFGQRGDNGIYFDCERSSEMRFQWLEDVNINEEKDKLLCFKTFIGGNKWSGCQENSCVGFYRVGFKLNVNIDNESKNVCFASFPDLDKDGSFSSVSLYRVNGINDVSACDTDNKILIYQNGDITKGIVEVTGDTISECPNLEIIDGNGVELESKIGITNIDVNNNNKNVENQYQTFGDSDEICEGSLKIEIWCSEKLGDGFTLEIEPDDINNESNSSQLEPLINALGEYQVNPKGLIESLSQLLVSSSMFDEKISGISRYDYCAFENWNDKNLKQKYKALVGRGTHSISTYGAKLNDTKYCGTTIKFKDVLQLQALKAQKKKSANKTKNNDAPFVEVAQSQVKSENETTKNIKAKEDAKNVPIKESDLDIKKAQSQSTTPLQKLDAQKKNEQEENDMLIGDEKQLQEQYKNKDKDKEVQSTKQTENVKKHGKPNVVLIFIKNNRRKITISIFSIGVGIAIGAIAGWIFAPILPIVDLVLILLDLNFNFLEPTEVSKGLDVTLNPKGNKPLGQNQIATERPGQENPDLSKSNTLLQ